MLLDNSGTVIWQENMPEQLPAQYTATDIAKFSRWYLDEYPVYVHENPEGLLVIGCAPGSLVKLNYSMDAKYISIVLTGIIFALLANLFLVLLMFWRNTRKVGRAITPILEGITKISEGKKVALPQKGELAEINSRLNYAGEYISKRDQARAEWINGVSHDIRTPLSYILGYAGEIEDNNGLPDAVREQAAIIQKQGEKLRLLIADLNLTSKLEYSMQPLNLQNMVPVEVTRQVIVDCMESGVDEKYSFDLRIDQAASQYSTKGDRDLFYRMLNNLIQNSIAHNTKSP